MLAGFENAVGSSFADHLIGNGRANWLSGGAGDDTLTGGAGADRLNGGAGSDTADYADATSGVSARPRRRRIRRGYVRLDREPRRLGIQRPADRQRRGQRPDRPGRQRHDRRRRRRRRPARRLRLSGRRAAAPGPREPATPRWDRTRRTTRSPPRSTSPTTSPSPATPTSSTRRRSCTTTVNATGNGLGGYYKVDLAAGTVVTIDIDGIADPDVHDSWVRLLDSDGNIVAENDDGGGDPGSVTTRDSSLVAVIQETGTYYILEGRWSPTRRATAGRKPCRTARPTS